MPVRRGLTTGPAVLEELARPVIANVHWHVEIEDWEPWRTGEEIATDTVAGAARTATAPWCCCTRGRAAPATGSSR